MPTAEQILWLRLIKRRLRSEVLIERNENQAVCYKQGELEIERRNVSVQSSRTTLRKIISVMLQNPVAFVQRLDYGDFFLHYCLMERIEQAVCALFVPKSRISRLKEGEVALS